MAGLLNRIKTNAEERRKFVPMKNLMIQVTKYNLTDDPNKDSVTGIDMTTLGTENPQEVTVTLAPHTPKPDEGQRPSIADFGNGARDRNIRQVKPRSENDKGGILMFESARNTGGNNYRATWAKMVTTSAASKQKNPEFIPMIAWATVRLNPGREMTQGKFLNSAKVQTYQKQLTKSFSLGEKSQFLQAIMEAMQPPEGVGAPWPGVFIRMIDATEVSEEKKIPDVFATQLHAPSSREEGDLYSKPASPEDSLGLFMSGTNNSHLDFQQLLQFFDDPETQALPKDAVMVEVVPMFTYNFGKTKDNFFKAEQTDNGVKNTVTMRGEVASSGFRKAFEQEDGSVRYRPMVTPTLIKLVNGHDLEDFQGQDVKIFKDSAFVGFATPTESFPRGFTIEHLPTPNFDYPELAQPIRSKPKTEDTAESVQQQTQGEAQSVTQQAQPTQQATQVQQASNISQAQTIQEEAPSDDFMAGMDDLDDDDMFSPEELNSFNEQMGMTR